MDEYISRNELLKDVQSNVAEAHNERCGQLLEAILNAPTTDVVPKSEEGAECPTCHGTGRIGTTNWLTKNMTKKQIAEEKAKAIAEHEKHIKREVAREIFEEIEQHIDGVGFSSFVERFEFIDWIAELKKKYTEENK